MEFYLKSKSLKGVKGAGFEEDFEIIILDDSIKCSKFVASFLSQKISKVLQTDFTTNHFHVNFPAESIYYKTHNELKEKIKRTNFINQLNNLITGLPIDINNKEQTYKKETLELLIEFGLCFDNEDMIELGMTKNEINSETTEITAENISEIIKLSRKLHNSELSNKSLKFISNDFSKICDQIDINEMTKSELETILSSSELRIESEDWLFELIYSKSTDFYFLFDYIEFEYLSREKVEILIGIIDNYEVSLHPRLWKSICRRLLSDGKKKGDRYNSRIIKRCKECPDGIIEYMRSISNVNRNPYESKLIDVETTTVENGEIKNLFDKSKLTDFRIYKQQNGFILLDFKDKRINFSKYYFSVPESQLGHTSGWPKSWEVEGSNDKKTWEMIDKKENDSSLKAYGRSNTFNCENATNQFYRYIRIKEIISHSGNQDFLLSEIEFYGSIENK